jgi:phosphoenolpyruvate carboxykinase (ATP)
VIRVKNLQTHELEEKGFLLFGLSGTGKTTLTVHDCGLKAPEGVIIRQDDVVMLTPDVKATGTEDGFFIKTEGLDPSQEVLYQAAIRDDAIFENVTLDQNGKPDFDDVSLTSNGRGIILRQHVGSTDDSVDLDQVDKMVFITRRDDIIPPLARLNPTQAAAFFMLGESIETSAGDPTKAGQAKREVGTNPFIIGPEAEEGNRLLKILEENPQMECYLMNTGSVGKRDGHPGVKCKVHHSTGLLREIARGTIEYEIDPFWGYEVAVSAGDLDLAELAPARYFNREELTSLNQELKDERVAWLNQFPGLDNRILETITGAGL